MASYEVERPSAKRRNGGNILSALIIVLYGVFLLLYYKTEVFVSEPDRIGNMWLTAGLFAVGIAGLISGIFRKNLVAFWISWAFIVPAVVNILVNGGVGTYGELYPVYILTPAIASAFTWLFSRAKSSHLKAIIFFSAVALACFLQSTGVLDWWYALIIGIVAIGLMVLINAITSRRGRWDDGDRPQRSKPIDMDNYDPKNKDV